MSRSALLLPALLLLALFARPVFADEPAAGKTVTLTCASDSEQRYACYLPSTYVKGKTWPILYCFSPNARGELFVERYRRVCEERGWIVVGSLNSKNGPWAPIEAATTAMWADTEARFSLSKTMRYASGFSGGARVSFALAEREPKKIAGVIAIGAGTHEPGKLPREGLACYLTCGKTDPNERELDPLHAKLKERGSSVHYENFEGGHVMPPAGLLEEAVRWMDDQAAERRAERFQEGIDLAKHMIEEEEDLVEAWVAVTQALEEYPDVKGSLRREAETLRKTLEKDKAVKVEVKAQKELAKVVVWIEKNLARIEMHDGPREQALENLQRIVDRYADSRAAARAKEILREVGAMAHE